MKFRPAPISLALLIAALPATALETRIGVRAESTHTDNTLRTPDNEVDEVTYQPGVNVQVDHQGASIRATGNYDYERRIRTEDFYDDSDALIGSSTLTWQALPGRLDVTVANTRTEATVNSQLGNVPDNLQVTDSTRAGATLRFRVRQNDEIQLQYFHTLTNADIVNTDSQRDTLSASYVWNVGQNDQLVANVADNKVNFDSDAAVDLNAVTSSLRWNRFGPTIDMSLMAGYTTMNRSSGRQNVDGEVFEARLTWRMTPQTSLSLVAARELRDRPMILEMGILQFGTNNQIDSDLNEVFRNDRAEVNFETTFLSTELLLNLTYDKQDYIDLPEDVERVSAALGLRRRLSPKLTLDMQASWREEHPLIAGIADEERWGGAVSLGYTHSRRLSFLLSGSHNSLESAAVINTYDENLYSLRVNYLLLE